MSSVEVGLLVIALGAVLILARLWRSAEARGDRLQADCEAHAAEAEQRSAELAKQTRARKRQAEELSTLRNKADKAKRRQSKGVAPPLGTAARMRDHEGRLEAVERERDGAGKERDELREEVARLETRLDAAARALAAALAEPASSPETESMPETESIRAREQAESDLLALRAELTERNQELGVARQTEARLRKRMNNQEQLYASLRAELDVKKDRLRTQEEQLQRLQALKVAVLD